MITIISIGVLRHGDLLHSHILLRGALVGGVPLPLQLAHGALVHDDASHDVPHDVFVRGVLLSDGIFPFL